MPKPTADPLLAELLERAAGESTDHARQRRYQAERDLLVAVLSTLWPAHIMAAAKPSLAWSEVVCIHSPAGQLAWGLPPDRADLFAHLERAELEAGHYDGHTASQRAARLRSMLAG